MPAPPRYYGSELISIKLKRRDVIFIGQTISKTGIFLCAVLNFLDQDHVEKAVIIHNNNIKK